MTDEAKDAKKIALWGTIYRKRLQSISGGIDVRNICGIVGIAGNLFAREELTMKRLLLVDSLRGMDSTGMAAVRTGGLNVYVAKKATHCFNLFDTKTFNDALNGTGSLAFIGHNRSATVGGIKDVNAHPFQIGHITGVHNGTLEDSDKALLEKLVGEKFNTDSEALFAAIEKLGAKEVIPQLQKGRDSLKGAWSLVWWDTKDRTLNFLRNEHRPMWYCYSEDFKQIFWASEFWMLDAVLQKAGNYSLYKKQSEKSRRSHSASSRLKSISTTRLTSRS
jgi:glucosamine 6-phosphate synthetase-like amidotransferase/phosphosugar isomerase protein